MTTPGAPRPDGAFVLGTAYGSDLTETSAKQIMKGGTVSSFTNAQNVHNTQVKAPIGAVSGEVTAQAGSIVGLEARVTALEGGGKRTTYSANFAATVPAEGKWGIGAFNGGSAGRDGAPSARGIAGLDGSYAYKEYDCAALRARGIDSVTGVVGAGGAANGQVGGATQVVANTGEVLLAPIQGGLGSILTAQGAVATSSTPGSGGRGGMNNENGGLGDPGEPSALAPGGAAGAAGGNNGQPGGSVPLDSDTPSGGGGGGGGSFSAQLATKAGDGGNGGAPGGGGGGGGANGNLNPVGIGRGGAGANGRAFIDETGVSA